MIVEFDHSFNKNLSKLLSSNLKLKIYAVIEEVAAANKLPDINNLKKMKGFKAFYRIKLGDYRIGFELINRDPFTLLPCLIEKIFTKRFHEDN
jgi:mRNA interferase RelE/StbE